MNCKNCGEIVNGKYCSNCGQNSNVRRINFANFSKDVLEYVFQVNHGFFYTFRELSFRPGESLKEFLEGRRQFHFRPISYLLTLSTLYYLINQFTNQNIIIEEIIRGTLSGASGEGSNEEILKISSWFSKHYAYSILLLLPVFSLASFFSFYTSNKNYFEHIVINSFVTGHQAIIYLFFAFVGKFINIELLDLFPVLGAIAYTFWVFWSLFYEGNRFVTLLRSILTYILYLIFCSALMAVLIWNLEL